MTINTEAFDRWIRSDFVAMNTELESLYRDLADPADIGSTGQAIKNELRDQGNHLIHALWQEGNTDEGFDAAFDLLGNVGFFMAACRRHELTLPERDSVSNLEEASALALQIGASIGVTPRFSTAHLTTHNRAQNGVAKSFTALSDERIFNELNTVAIFSFQRAAEALIRVKQIGIGSPLAIGLLEVAELALKDVVASNKKLGDQLCVREFFYHVRPYYKPHHVGNRIFRGANAGDFAGINVIDLLLGVCRADDPYYSQLLIEKLLYMMPGDQRLLKDVMRRRSLLADILAEIDVGNVKRANISAFLKVFEAHAQTAKQHHNMLVERFIVEPSRDMDSQHLRSITASGPALEQLLTSLEKLRDLRCAAKTDRYTTAFAQYEKLRAVI